MATKDKAQKKAKLRHAEYYDFQEIQDKLYADSLKGREFKHLVEIVSTCSSGWKMTPEKANKWMEEHMFPFYPLGDLKDKE